MKIGLQNRVIGAMLALDLPFTILYLLAYAQMLGAHAGVTAAATLPVFLARLAVWGPLAVHLLRPSDELARARGPRQRITPEAVRRADALLQRAPLGLSVVFSALWGLQVALVTLVHYALGSPLALPAGVGVVLTLLVGTGLAGALGVIFPLLNWLVSDAAGRNYLEARRLGIELDRANSSVPTRIASLGVLLSLTPVMLMGASGYAAQVTTAAERAEIEAARAAAEFEGTTAPGPRELDAVAVSVARERATAFAVAPDGRLLSAGRPLPPWLDAEFARRADEAGQRPPEPGVALRTRQLPDGVIVGAAVRSAAVSSSYLLVTLVVAIILVAWGPICAMLLSKSISGPLQRVAAATRRLVEEGDLSKIGTLPVAYLDEYGALTAHTNDLLDTMRELGRAAGEVAGGNLDVAIEGRGELPDSFGRMLASLRELVGQLSSTSSELAGAAVEILAATQEQEAAANSQSSGMTEVAQTMDTLSNSAAHVAESVQGVLQNAERTLKNTEQMVSRINALTGHANRIGDILEVIRDIADRTDLLALNGSLEATRVGEAGRGFALVATEMRRLAERVTASVKDIKDLVTDIRESGASTVIATEESKKLAEETTEAARSITLVTQQQRNGTDQVTYGLREVVGVVAQAASATSQTREAAEGLKVRAERLAELVKRFKLAS